MADNHHFQSPRASAVPPRPTEFGKPHLGTPVLIPVLQSSASPGPASSTPLEVTCIHSHCLLIDSSRLLPRLPPLSLPSLHRMNACRGIKGLCGILYHSTEEKYRTTYIYHTERENKRAYAPNCRPQRPACVHLGGLRVSVFVPSRSTYAYLYLCHHHRLRLGLPRVPRPARSSKRGEDRHDGRTKPNA